MDLGLSQAALADRLGVWESTLRGWELGRYRPTVRLLPKVDAFLNRIPKVPLRSLGARVRATRQRLGLSQAALARCVRIDRVTVWSVETGRRPPSERTLERLLTFLEANDGQRRRR